MQVNHLSQLLFPTLTPGVTSGPPDAAGKDTQGSQAADGASRATRAPTATQRPESSQQSAPEASVKLELGSSQRARAPETYGPDSLFAGKSGIDVASTPAERFVATAVDIMRAYEQEHVKPETQGPFTRIKQSMSRFSAQA